MGDRFRGFCHIVELGGLLSAALEKQPVVKRHISSGN